MNTPYKKCILYCYFTLRFFRFLPQLISLDVLSLDGSSILRDGGDAPCVVPDGFGRYDVACNQTSIIKQNLTLNTLRNLSYTDRKYLFKKSCLRQVWR